MVSSEVLDLREDPVKGVQVAGLSEIEVDTPEEILDLLMYLIYQLIFYLDLVIEIVHVRQQEQMKQVVGRMQYYK
jgi:hypothetical protein